MLEDFKNFVASLNLAHAKFAVAVSGGIDSSVLCALCAMAKIPFFIVHCNFKLRAEESDRDEQFVRSLAKKYNVEILIKEFDTEKYSFEKKCSVQVAARELRYQWFTDLHQQDNNIYILLAHHANDDIETLMMNFFRGTGLEGLTGMPSIISYNFCLRPLLNNTRYQIETFAKEHNLEWVEDSSNQSSKYTRNFFRNELMPMLKRAYPNVEANLLDNISRFKKINALYKIGVDKLKKEICENKAPDVIIPIHRLKAYQNTSLIYEILREYGFGEKQVDEINKLLNSESGKYIENEFYQIIRHRKNLIITPKFSDGGNAFVIEKDAQTIQLGNTRLKLQFYSFDNFKLNKSENVAQVDATLISFPLLIRKWVRGDYFYPLGLKKKKKLSRFFIDQKLSLPDKEKIWVIESGKRIIWVAGLRIDDRFKITGSTKEVLELSISNL